MREITQLRLEEQEEEREEEREQRRRERRKEEIVKGVHLPLDCFTAELREVPLKISRPPEIQS